MNQGDILQPIIAAANKAAARVDGDFLGDSGLLYCGRCHTPKQCRIIISGREIVVGCQCRCSEEESNRAVQAAKNQERRQRIQSLRINGVQDKALRSMSFETDDRKNPDLLDKAHRYFNAWDRMYLENWGLLFWGNTGTGKTFAASCIANALIEKGIPVLCTSFPKLLTGLQGMTPESRVDYLQSLDKFDLLVIDDLGVERNTPYAIEQVYSVIDGRYKNGQPMIITTNLSLSEMQHPSDMACQRIYDRVLERCVPLHAKGDSRRKELAADRMKEAVEFFA